MRKEALGSQQPVSEEKMDRSIGSEHASPSDFWSVALESSPSVRSESKAVFRLSRGEALILVLLLSFGFWVAVWGAVALLAGAL